MIPGCNYSWIVFWGRAGRQVSCLGPMWPIVSLFLGGSGDVKHLNLLFNRVAKHISWCFGVQLRARRHIAGGISSAYVPRMRACILTNNIIYIAQTCKHVVCIKREAKRMQLFVCERRSQCALLCKARAPRLGFASTARA
jgi:hypothetical protein